MKKTLMIALALCLGFGSCKKSATNSNTTKVSITGKWRYKKTRTQTFNTAGVSTLDVTFTAFTDADYLLYNADGTGVSMSQGSEFDFTYSYSGTTDTDYPRPASPGDKAIIVTVTLSSTTMLRHSESTGASGYKTVQDEELTML